MWENWHLILTSGIIATVAVDVWTRPIVSVCGTRWTRCTPDSNFSLLYTCLPFTSITYVLYPPFSAWKIQLLHQHFAIRWSGYGCTYKPLSTKLVWTSNC
jgi:hypothetical protein